MNESKVNWQKVLNKTEWLMGNHRSVKSEKENNEEHGHTMYLKPLSSSGSLMDNIVTSCIMKEKSNV